MTHPAWYFSGDEAGYTARTTDAHGGGWESNNGNSNAFTVKIEGEPVF